MKLKLKGRWFNTIEEIQVKSQRVLDTLTEKDFQEAFQKWRRQSDQCLHAGGYNLRVTAANRPYGEFYDFYSVSPENFGSTLPYIIFVKASNIQYDQSRIVNYILVLIAAYFTHCS